MWLCVCVFGGPSVNMEVLTWLSCRSALLLSPEQASSDLRVPYHSSLPCCFLLCCVQCHLSIAPQITPCPICVGGDGHTRFLQDHCYLGVMGTFQNMCVFLRACIFQIEIWITHVCVHVCMYTCSQSKAFSWIEPEVFALYLLSVVNDFYWFYI